MDKDLLDIIDTTIKIGLGAFISGASAYLLSITKYSKDKEKDKRDKTIQLLKDIALKIQKAEEILDKATNELWHVAAGTESATYEDAKIQVLNYYSESISLFSHAKALAHLINEKDIYKHIEKIVSLLVEIYKKSALHNLENEDDTEEEINAKYIEISSLMNSCYSKIGDAYCNA